MFKIVDTFDYYAQYAMYQVFGAKLVCDVVGLDEVCSENCSSGSKIGHSLYRQTHMPV